MSYLLLKIFQNSRLLKTKIFTEDQISIGKSEGLSLHLPELSPWHLLIEKKQNVFSILDLNSETGTFVNGAQITEESLLKSGDVIKAGPYEIHFFAGSKKAGQDLAGSTHAASPAEPPRSEATPAGQADLPPEPTPAEQVPPQLESTHPGKAPPPSGPEENFYYSDGFYKVSKPEEKGFWKTYAPPSQIKNLEDIVTPSIGNLIEVNLVWRDRVLQTHTFSKGGDIYMGSDKKSQIKFPPMIQQESYKLLSISSGAKVYLKGAVKGVLFQGKDQKTRTSHKLNGNQTVALKPYEMLKLDFGEELKIYVRLMDKPSKMPLVDLLNLRLSESLALLFAFLLTGLLFFYGALYAPAFLAKDIDFIEKDIRMAQIVFEKKAKKTQVLKYDLTERVKPVSIVKKVKTQKIRQKKRPSLRNPITKRVKKTSTPKTGPQGKMAVTALGRKTKAKPKVKIGSVRPGGSLKTGKAGSSAKTKAPDPSKVGVLGAFGPGGRLEKLDKGASGPGGLTGLANQYTGFGGTTDTYEGEGIGAKTKELISGGQGESLVGATGIKTGGKGLGLVGSGPRGLGQRGRLSMEFSTEEIDVVGEIDREAIARVIRRNRAKFDRCYQQSLNDEPSIQGKLLMKWRISSRGRGTGAVALRSGIDSSSLKRCVGRVLNSLIFPVPPSGQIPEVTFPFSFAL